MIWLFLLILGDGLVAAELHSKTLKEFEAYMKVADSAMEPGAASRQRIAIPASGGPVVEPWDKRGARDVTDGLIHDWRGACFVKGARVEDAIQVLQDIDRYKDIYRPDVTSARLISRNGDRLEVKMRVVKQKVITVVLDTDYEVSYRRISDTTTQVWSRSTRISEVEDPWKPSEKLKPPDTGWGFLWRLNSYWRLEQVDGGLYMELRSISLTRGIPVLLKAIIKPMVTSLPKEAVGATVENTRRAVAARLTR